MDPKLFQKISYGMFVVTSLDGKHINGQIANTVFQITNEPACMAVSINKKNYTHQCIMKSKKLAVSILAQTATMELIGVFGFKSGRELEKFTSITYELGVTGAPVLVNDTVGYFEAEVINSIDVETHTVFICRVIEAKVLAEVEPMTYAYYHQVKKGSAPATAPTYFKPEGLIKPTSIESNEPEMDKYKCTVCGYIYDPERGDEAGHIQPQTPFKALPNQWTCPICGASKESFEIEN